MPSAPAMTMPMMAVRTTSSMIVVPRSPTAALAIRRALRAGRNDGPQLDGLRRELRVRPALESNRHGDGLHVGAWDAALDAHLASILRVAGNGPVVLVRQGRGGRAGTDLVHRGVRQRVLKPLDLLDAILGEEG